MSVQSWLNRIWYGSAPPPWWLLPFVADLWRCGAIAALPLCQAAAHIDPLSSPVIVVGNLSVGGTGKTPLVCWLVERLTDQGFRPGVVARGYGGSSGSARLIEPGDDPDLVGDESILLHVAPECRWRSAAIARLPRNCW